MKYFRRPWIAACGLFVGLTVLLSACRSTPVVPPAEPAPEIPAVMPSQPEVPGELSRPPARPAEIAPLPPPDAIQRHLPESRIGKPAKDLAAHRVDYHTWINSRVNESSRNGAAWRYRTTRQGEIVGFEFSNHGGNRILPPRHNAAKNHFFTRDFQFRFDERARQDIHLLVSDWVPSRDRTFRLSELMNSLMLFFPRTVLPAIVSSRSRNIVTLPTGEEIEFDAASHEIVAGVLSEGPVDLNPDRAHRKFPGLEYLGDGVLVRANARGADPRIATTAMITSRAAAPSCDKGSLCNQCQVPAKELWEQNGAVRFKFATDGDFDRFLVRRCGFGLPKVAAGYAIGVPLR